MWVLMGHGTAFLTDHSRAAPGYPAGLERNACFDSQLPFFDLMAPQAHNSLHACMHACIQARALPCTTSNMPILPASVSGKAR